MMSFVDLELKKSIDIVCESGPFSFAMYLVDFLLDVLRMKINSVYFDLMTMNPSELHSFLLNIDGFVRMFDGRWVTSDALINIHCQEMLIYFNKLTCTDINLFIKNWMNSSDTKLRVFQIAASFGNYQEKLFRGLEDSLRPWDKSKRGPLFETQAYALDCQNGLDIERSDGMIATLCVDESIFSFVVWHDRFPQVTKQLPSVEESLRVQFLTVFLRSPEWYQAMKN
ncbi:hypothetical protein CRE_04398 [Caenorhabditis remanei]|uniref:Sdz-33 F-box domain-containing protein n=1 Tax=Caenorhabditis remanei TaxID=31234 RepID=E3NLU9_CAERE|nr:hypothetical protein CRE_04398 [Caenorhabditis remanei]